MIKFKQDRDGKREAFPDPQGLHRKHFKDMIQDTMDNHVVITHCIKKHCSKSRKLDIFSDFGSLCNPNLDSESFEIDSCFSKLVRTDSCASGGVQGQECSASSTLTRSNSI
jgi:hypothetical protein